MTTRSLKALTALGLALCLAGPGVSAAKKPVKKAPPKKPAATKKAPVLGTKQFSGEQAVFGHEYTLGKDNPMNITVNSAEFTADRLKIGLALYFPGADEKFLVVHYTLHNPVKTESLVRFDTFTFTAVDSTNTNREFTQVVGVESNSQDLSMSLKPGQKVDAFTFIPVPAKGDVPKLVIKSPDDLVLRYDLKGRIKPLTGPAADPSDTTGTTARSKVPAVIGTTYQTGDFDVTLNSAEFSTTPIKGYEFVEDETGRYLMLGLTITNCTTAAQLVRFDTLNPKLTDSDGADIDWPQEMLSGTRDASFSADVEPGQEVKVRYFFKLETGQTPKTLTLTEMDKGRFLVYDVSGTK